MSDICSVSGCDRLRDKKQRRKICTMHRTRLSKYKSYDLPTKPQLPDGIVKVCKNHGELNKLEVYVRGSKKNWLNCKYCVRASIAKTREKYGTDYKKNYEIKSSGLRVSKKYYEDLLEKQNYVCAICFNPETIKTSPKHNNPKRLAIDHCHETNMVRGLLCHKCNVSLGAMEDSIKRFESAIAYLKKHNSS